MVKYFVKRLLLAVIMTLSLLPLCSFSALAEPPETETPVR